MTAPLPSVSPELKSLIAALKLGRLLDTLPERLALARSHDLTHMELLEQLFYDEVQRRDGDSAGRRARAAKLDATMTLEAWDESARSLITGRCGQSSCRCDSSSRRETPLFSGRSESERRSLPPPSGTSPAAGASGSTSNGPTVSTSG